MTYLIIYVKMRKAGLERRKRRNEKTGTKEM